MSLSADVIAGQALYTKSFLKIYDQFVHAFSTRYVWYSPTENIQKLYRESISNNHLEVGVGTGYFLDHSKFPTQSPRLVLLDLNPNCLEYALHRLARYKPKTYQANILEPLDPALKPFDSIGMTYVFHCLPGKTEEKAIVFSNLKSVLNPGGILFGATILPEFAREALMGRILSGITNRLKIHSNEQDSLAGIRAALGKYFPESHVEVQGGIARFWAMNPH